MTKFVTPFTRKLSSIRDVNVKEFTAPNKVARSLSYATDINVIYDNYVRTNKLPLNGRQPIYDENFIKYDSLIEAQKIVSEACQYFDGLPGPIKNQYGNDMYKFIKALNNCDDFLVKNGVLKLKTDDIKVDIVENPSVSDIQPIETPQPTNDTASAD